MNISDLLILLLFLIEVVVFTFIDKKLWKTLYTPFSCLMLPTTLVLLITVAIAGNGTFVPFYFPSLYIYMLGGLAFFIPSALLSLGNQRWNPDYKIDIKPIDPRPIQWIGIVAAILFLFRFLMMARSSSFAIGTDEFGEGFAGFGLFGHLRELLMSVIILMIFFFNRSKKWYLLVILAFVSVAFLNQVKSWMLIPLVAGLLLRLYTSKTRLSVWFIIRIVLLGLAVFFISYTLLLIIGGYGEMSIWFIEFVFDHFLHYLTSGILGLSEDARLGFPEPAHWEYLFSSVINLWNTISGNELVRPINPYFFDTGVSGTNVRSLFGTVYINLGAFGSIVFMMLLSTVLYLLRIVAIHKNSIFIYTVDFWFCALLCMAWFDYYFHVLSAVEVPVWLMILAFLSRFKFWRNGNPVIANPDNSGSSINLPSDGKS